MGLKVARSDRLQLSGNILLDIFRMFETMLLNYKCQELYILDILIYIWKYGSKCF